MVKISLKFEAVESRARDNLMRLIFWLTLIHEETLPSVFLPLININLSAPR